MDDNNTSKKVSLEQVFNLSYEKAQDLAKDLMQREDEELREMGQLIAGLDPTFFDPTLGQQQLKIILDYLQNQDVDETRIIEIIKAISEVSYLKSEQYIRDLLPGELIAQWEEITKHRPNVFQQMVLINHICQKLAGKDYDDIYDEMLLETANEFISGLEEELELNNKISNLSEEDVEQANKLFDEGKYEEAMTLIYQVK